MSTLTARLMAFGIIAIAAFAAGPASACPSGSQFFAYGGAGGCVADGKQVMKCYSMGKDCPTGWSNEGQAESGSWCCPPPPVVKRDDSQPVQSQSCTWRGTAPFCKGSCEPGEIGRASSSDGEGTYPNFGATCLSGLKAYCCRLTFPSQ